VGAFCVILGDYANGSALGDRHRSVGKGTVRDDHHLPAKCSAIVLRSDDYPRAANLTSRGLDRSPGCLPPAGAARFALPGRRHCAHQREPGAVRRRDHCASHCWHRRPARWILRSATTGHKRRPRVAVAPLPPDIPSGLPDQGSAPMPAQPRHPGKESRSNNLCRHWCGNYTTSTCSRSYLK
jgi:hypothetical protein